MTDSVTITMIDNTGERTSFGFSVAPIIGANLGTLKTAVTALEGLIDAVGLLPVASDNISIKTKFSVNKPSDVNANREVGVRFLMRDVNGNKTFVTLGGPDLAQFPFADAGTDIIPIDYPSLDGDVVALAIWLEDNAKHPLTGADLTVYALEQVGRNL